MTKQMKIILQDHRNWLIGIGGKRADLRDADLRGATLRNAVLTDAVLRGADLRGAVLSGADLRGADLAGATLRNAVLRGADLRGAVLRGAVLRGANLRDAILWGAVLRGADLWGADLWNADLGEADLDVKIPPVADHNFISAILFKAASNTEQRRLAGLVRISLDWCWEDFLQNCDASEIAWAKKVLCGRWDEFEGKFRRKKVRV